MECTMVADQWFFSLIADDGDFVGDVTSRLADVRSANWSKEILECMVFMSGVLGHDWYRSLLVDVFSTSFTNEEQPYTHSWTWTFRVQLRWRHVNGSFIRRISAALARSRNTSGQVEQGRASNFTLTLAVNRITAYHYWLCILKSVLLWCECKLTFNSYNS